MNLDFLTQNHSQNSFFADTHCHLDFPAFESDREEVILNSFNKGVRLMINVGVDVKSSQRSFGLALKYPFIYAAVGIHPSEVANVKEGDLKEIEKLAQEEKVVAIGEVGLDYFRLKDKTIIKKQKDLFLRQIEIAQKLSLPLIVHCRDAFSDAIEMLKTAKVSKVVFHCFTGTKKHLEEILKNGFWVSYTGIVTFPNASSLRENVKETPLENLLLETDCPYLAPQSRRGLRCEPFDVIEVAQKIAEIKNQPLFFIGEKTFQNALLFFNIKDYGKN